MNLRRPIQRDNLANRTLRRYTSLAAVAAFIAFVYSSEAATNPPTPQPAATPSPSPTAGFSDFAQFLVVIEGNYSVGSGFLAKFQDAVWLFTNSHVLSGNTTVKPRLLSGSALAIGELAIAEKYDISRFAQTTYKDGIQILENLDSEVQIGDEVVVLGNSLGSGVVTEIKGKVTGVGPELIEVDAKFVSGNSGSPIIHSKTKKLIGIATFSVMRSMEGFGSDSKFNAVERRFGYRLDNVPGWHKTTWAKFAKESSILNTLRARTDDVWSLAVDIADDGRVTDWNKHLQRDNNVRMNVSSWQQTLGKAGSSGAGSEILSGKKRLLNGVIMTLRGDLGFLKPEQFTGYNREEFTQALGERKLLTDYFRLLEDQLTNDPDFHTR